ncbi:hypothetical protein PCE1_002975 [Barthelona sp. PCE]
MYKGSFFTVSIAFFAFLALSTAGSPTIINIRTPDGHPVSHCESHGIAFNANSVRVVADPSNNCLFKLGLSQGSPDDDFNSDSNFTSNPPFFDTAPWTFRKGANMRVCYWANCDVDIRTNFWGNLLHPDDLPTAKRASNDMIGDGEYVTTVPMPDNFGKSNDYCFTGYLLTQEKFGRTPYSMIVNNGVKVFERCDRPTAQFKEDWKMPTGDYYFTVVYHDKTNGYISSLGSSSMSYHKDSHTETNFDANKFIIFLIFVGAIIFAYVKRDVIKKKLGYEDPLSYGRV